MPTARPADRRDLPAYLLAEASHYVRLAPATLRSWVVGRPYAKRDGKGFFEPLIAPADKQRLVLSFNNLVEAHVLRALRTEHGVSIRDVRTALSYAEQQLGIERLLLREELRTSAGEIFLERYGDLVNLSRSGQLAMKRVLDVYLDRVDWKAHLPIRLHPFLSVDVTDSRSVAIDPAVGFGRPILHRVGIATAIIAERIDAGESVDDIAADYDLTREETLEAAVYERAA